MLKNKYTFKTFKDGNFSIDIKISLDEDTIWLNESEIALIFECPRRTINYHLNNLIRDNNLSDSVWQESCQTASDGKQYNTKIYNLETTELLSYKVRSKRVSTFLSNINNIINQIKGVNKYYERRL